MSTKGLMSPSLMREGEGAGALCVNQGAVFTYLTAVVRGE